ncbi:hypothetical protein [Acrocarpospora sp. B8E8]|uniref:hypothetical protein n=1 Tax=Acrocarpospora sp. B8E8 TaxID=3153572 RepID=UPI00325E1A18
MERVPTRPPGRGRRWRLYLSCATYGTKHWRVELLEAATPAASDRGQALGCALYGWHHLTGELPRRPLAAARFGRPYSDSEIGLSESLRT